MFHINTQINIFKQYCKEKGSIFAAEKRKIVEYLGQGMKTRQTHQIKRAAAKMPLKISKQILEAAVASAVLSGAHQGAESSRGPRFCVTLLFSHLWTMPSSKSGCSGPRDAWRHIFKQPSSLIGAVQCLMVQINGVLDGWWIANMFQQGCNVSKEAVESCFGLESSGKSWSAISGSLKVWKWPRKEMWSFWLTTFFHGREKKNHTSSNKIIFMHDNPAPSCAARSTYVFIIGYYVHKMRKIDGVTPSSADLKPIENL